MGSALAGLLSQRGRDVWGVRRSAATLPEGVALLQADVLQKHTLEWPAALDAAVYCVSPRESTELAYQHAYVNGLANVLDSLAEQGHQLRRFILVSSTGVYSQDDGEQIDETSPAEPARPIVRPLLRGESIALASGLPVTVVRLSGIYGPGRDRIVRSVRDGSAVIERGSRAVLNHIHLEDCAGILAHMLSLPAPAPLYIGTDCEPVYKNDALSWIAQELGLPAPAQAPLSLTQKPRRGGHRFLRNRLLLASGYTFRYPTYREGYASLF